MEKRHFRTSGKSGNCRSTVSLIRSASHNVNRTTRATLASLAKELPATKSHYLTLLALNDSERRMNQIVSFLFMSQDLKDDLMEKHLDLRCYDQSLRVIQWCVT